MEIVTLQGVSLEEVTKEDEESEEGLPDVSRYIGEFKHLESLRLEILRLVPSLTSKNISLIVRIILKYWTLLLSKILRSLVVVVEAVRAMQGLGGRVGGGSPVPQLTASDRRVVESPQGNNSLRRLVIWHYTHQNLYYEVMYLVKKFVNLEFLQLANQMGLFWSPITETEFDAVMDYLFSLSCFHLSTAFSVTLNSVKQTFDAFIKNQQNSTYANKNQKVEFEIILM